MRRLRASGRRLAAALLAAAVAGSGCGPPFPEAEAGPPDRDACPPLAAGEPRSASLARDAARGYCLDLEAGEAVEVRLDQRTVDLVVAVFDPQGRPRVRFDAPAGRDVAEIVCFVAEENGTYRLRVTPYAGGGDTAVELARRRPAVAEDRACQQAAAALRAAEEARRQEPASRPLVARYESARRRFADARQPVLEAVVEKEIGGLLAALGATAEATAAYRRGLALVRPLDQGRLAVTLLNSLGDVHLSVGEIADARRAFEDAVDLARSHRDGEAEAGALNRLGRLAEGQGEAHRAAALYRQALDLWHAAGSPEAAVARHNLAGSYLMLERFAAAEDLLAEALAAARQSEWRSLEASVLTTLGWSRFRRGRLAEAVELLEQALAIRRDLGERTAEVGVLDRLGSVQRRRGRTAEALASYRAALEISLATGNLRYADRTRVNLGCLQAAAGDAGDALEPLRAALSHLEERPDPDTRTNAHFCLAQAERRLGRLAPARDHLEQALDTVDALRRASRREGVWHPPVEDWQDYAELYVSVLLELAEDSDAGHGASDAEVATAFAASDLARARSFYELIFESQLDLRSRADPALLERKAVARRRLAEIGERLEASPEPAPDLERQARRLALELDQLEAEIRLSSPLYDPLLDPPAVTLREVQETLDPATALLSYALGKERSVLFLVTRDSVRTVDLGPRVSIEQAAERFHDGLRRSRFPRGREQAGAAARELADTLLAPLTQGPVPDRLLVVAEGALHYVPFAALSWPGGSGDRRLIDRVEVVHLPSAAVLAALRRRSAGRPRPTGQLAVVADAVFSAADPRVAGRSATASGGPRAGSPTGEEATYERLFHTRREAEAILELVPAARRQKALDFDATADLVRSGELGRYRIVHLASHALIDERNPALSQIVLSLVDRDGRPLAGGRLLLAEIYGLRLPADLVVLSACRSALGKRVRGDGLLSFTRGFFYAGASRLLVSLWDVDDDATADLMIRFYQGLLAEGLTPAAALRQAQLWTRRQPGREAPYYWAGLVLQGEPD